MATAEQQEARGNQPKVEQRSTGTPQSQRSTGANQSMERAPKTASPAARGSYAPGPFSMMRRLGEDMDRIFSDFFGPGMCRWG